MSTPIEDDILRSLRRITRAIDLHSRQLANSFGLTGPQLVCLRTIQNLGPTKPSVLAREVSLSQATITGIIDRLLTRQLVTRERSSEDRRVVTIAITTAGDALVEQAPSPLQEEFAANLSALPVDDQRRIRDTLVRVVDMMGGAELAAAPVLSTSPSAMSSEEVDAVSTDRPADVMPATPAEESLLPDYTGAADVDPSAE